MNPCAVCGQAPIVREWTGVYGGPKEERTGLNVECCGMVESGEPEAVTAFWNRENPMRQEEEQMELPV